MAAILTLDSLAELLTQAPTLETVPVSDPDATFVLDSLGLTWLVHLLDEKHHMTVDLADPRLLEPTSLRRLLEHVNGAAMREGTPGV